MMKEKMDKSKKTKAFKITSDINPNIKIEGNMINIHDIKSFYMTVECWYPNDVNALLWGKRMKKKIYESLDKSLFTDRIIDILDVPESKQYSYYHSMFEYTIFLNKPNSLSHSEIESHVNKIAVVISNLYDSADFKFYKDRKDVKKNNN